ncbi:cardiolipin synthase [uncultured Pelagimonas sp.]|uniref:cardiolipin synthase n=1 Tax=uncultured Pelagimonas sp. TaxID=1618102 RepID=UPI00262B4171|nr:cardiolipin synthase [uncultured Pelagimonas sp.]
MSMSLFPAILVILEIIALWFSWKAISSSRTPQGAIGWVIFLVTMPLLGIPLYLLFGHHKFSGYVIARRDSEEAVEGLKKFRDENAPETAPEFPVQIMEKISEMPAVRGNNMEILIDGDQTFQAIFEAIDAAQSYVLVQFYIVHNDTLGKQLKERMIAAAKRGVEVKFMFDAVGSVALPRHYFQDLRAAGVQTVDPRDMRGPKNRFQINFRNHRKTVIVDGTVGFTGGLNVGDEYMGKSPKFGAWRDTHVRLKGPIVSQLQLIFAEDWHWATEQVLLTNLNWVSAHDDRDMTGMIVSTGPGDNLETGALFFFSAISAAKSRIWIATPYFVPDTDVLTALKHAVLRGVDVRILVPDVIDHYTPWLAAFAYFDEIQDVGAQIWRYKDGFMHQKVVLVDDSFAAIGTSNLDNRSFRLNFEAMAVMYDPRAAAETEAFLLADFERSEQLTKKLKDQRLAIRVGAPISRIFSPLL